MVFLFLRRFKDRQFSNYFDIAADRSETRDFFLKKLLILYFKKLSLHSEKRGVFRLSIPKPK